MDVNEGADQYVLERLCTHAFSFHNVCDTLDKQVLTAFNPDVVFHNVLLKFETHALIPVNEGADQ